ncbi:hypothetical protein CBS101457_002925 [Exobasidium rhododendri]|nr:hypothetical protein CBS101457_002925 [Exobasidium rhododendri]
MYGPNGAPLPPTKQQEISEAEREARKQAIIARHRGSIPHSLVKTSILLESRSVKWKRISGLTSVQERPVAGDLDTSSLDPWSLELKYGGSNAEMIDMAERRVKKMYEISKSKRIGTCDQCHGTKVDKCRSCRSSLSDICWWCKGSGKAGGGKCTQCTGAGVMICQTCNGLPAACQSCQGEGKGMFAAFVQVAMVKIDLEIVPLSTIVKASEAVSKPQAVEAACIQKTRILVTEYLSAMTRHVTKEKGKLRSHRPRRVFCSLHNSNSHLVELEVPREAKVVINKEGAPPCLRPRSRFQRKVPFATLYYILPSDLDLSPAELTLAELEATLKEQEEKDRISRYRHAKTSSAASLTSIGKSLTRRLSPSSPPQLSVPTSVPFTTRLSMSLQQQPQPST